MPLDSTPIRRAPARLHALRRLHMLDTPPEEGFDRLTRLAARTLRVPIALVNLIDAERQFFKSAVGMGEIRELSAETGVCSFALETLEPLVLEDARLDPRFSSNPIVTEYGLVAYIGVPLITSQGHALGTFCVVDTEPRAWRDEDVETVSDLAGAVATEMDLRLAAHELEQKVEEAEAARAVADALGTSDVGTFILDADFRVAWANHAVERFFGLRRAEAIGADKRRLVREHVAPVIEDGDRFAGQVLRTYDDNSAIAEFECRVRAGDGRPARSLAHWSRPIRSGIYAGGRIEHYYDVTERNRTDARIRFQAHLLNAVGQAVLATDPEGRITFWNRAAEALYGWTGAEVLGRDVLDVTPAELSRAQAAELMARLAAGESWSGEFMVRRRDGTSFPVMVNDTPVFDEAGALMGVIGVSWDLSERRRAEEVLRAAKEEAEWANRSKTEFLSAMSHELRTPLNAIGGYLDLIELGVHGPVTEAQRGSFERIKRNQEHLLTLINDILHYAKIEAGRTEFRMAEVLPEEMLRGVEVLFEPQARARGIAYSVETSAAAVPALCDPDRVHQILLNLVGNAIKFTDPGGWVMLSSDADESRVHVRVSDNGRGIPPDRIRTVFDPFVQLERHRNESSQQGVGLGLAISRDLARGMGGDVTVESAPARGSTFTLSLPRARAADPEAEADD